jgi:hypothetical protein
MKNMAMTAADEIAWLVNEAFLNKDNRALFHILKNCAIFSPL